jgi:acyl-coenzyme A synthetase/AMP-(fatty) acid ligase
VVADADKNVRVADKINELVDKKYITSKVRKIEFTEKELPKNKLGKIIRKNQQMNDK